MLKHKKGLFRDNQKVIRNKEWYNQRFDGCLNFMWIISELEINKEKRKMDKGSFSSHVCVVKDGRADWYIEMDDIKRITDMFLSKLKTSNALGKKIMKKWENDEELFRQFISNLEKSVLTKASDKELKELYYEFLERYKKAISCSSLIDGFALGSDEIVQKEVEKLLDKRGIGKGRGETFSLLTAPVHQSFVNEAELSLLKIALEVKKFRDKTKAWKDEKIKKMISKHRDNYFWVNNNFFDSHDLNKSYFVRKIKAIVSSKVNIKEEIAKIKNTSAVNKRKKEALINKLKPSKYLKNLLEISEDFTNWQDERKKRTLFFTHYSNMFLQEMSKRFKLELEHLKGLSHSEICDMLEGKQFSLKELKDRSKTIIAYQKGNNYEVISGDRAEKVVANIFKKDCLVEVFPWPVVDPILIALPVAVIVLVVSNLLGSKQLPEKHVDSCFNGIK